MQVLHLMMSKLMTYMKAATASIDLGALEHNLQLIKSKAPNCKVMSVVKANGYGHGLLHLSLIHI